MRRYPRFSVVVVMLALLALPSPVGGATAKPSRLLVPAGATTLYWSYPMPLASGVRYGTLRVTNESVIARVRDLINAIPVSDYGAGQACPDDMMVPDIVRFSTSTAAASFTKVVFQLGGCPHATVFQRGVAQRPTLGGWTLSRSYDAIQKVISPKGQPLA